MNPDHEPLDVVGVLTGESSVAGRRAARAHLDGCASCRTLLVESATLIGELRDAARHSPVDPAQVPPFDLAAALAAAESGGPGPAPHAPETLKTLKTLEGPDQVATPPQPRHRDTRRHGRRWLAAAGALALIAGAGLGGLAVGRSTSPPSVNRPAASVIRLAAITPGPTPATGDVHMTGSGSTQRMVVRLVGLRTPAPGEHYEVWLLDTRSDRLLDIGAAPQSGTSTYAAPAGVVAEYNTIDVSVQAPADHGRHSGHSVLRGALF